jgi:hypothetical protein
MMTRIDVLSQRDELFRGDYAARRDASPHKSAGAARQIDESTDVVLAKNAPAQ